MIPAGAGAGNALTVQKQTAVWEQEYQRTRGILLNSNWRTVDLIGVHLADNGKSSPAGLGKAPRGI